MGRSVIRRAARLIFIDETGINLSMTRTHARAPAGVRAVDAVPKNWGDNITVTAALTLDGIVAPMMLYGAMNARAFDAYVEQTGSCPAVGTTGDHGRRRAWLDVTLRLPRSISLRAAVVCLHFPPSAAPAPSP